MSLGLLCVSWLNNSLMRPIVCRIRPIHLSSNKFPFNIYKKPVKRYISLQAFIASTMLSSFLHMK